MNETCTICLDNINSYIKCKNTDCNTIICDECFKHLIIYSENEKILPKCQNINCKFEYLYSDIKTYPEVISNYLTTLINYLINDNNNTLSEIEIQEKIRKQIYKKRIEYINKYPIAIKNIIDITLSTKLKKINKQNKLIIETQLQQLDKKCFNLLCNGKLDENYNCMLCEKKFCIKCEKKITNHHVCNDDDIKNLEFVKSLIKCPKCKLPILRSWGCNMMTCSHCRTNFDYTTGQITIAGNHKNDEQIQLKTNILPSLIYANDNDTNIINLLKQIEKYQPKQNNIDKLIIILSKYKNSTNIQKNILKTKIAKKYEIFKINEKHNIIYNKFMVMIQDIHDENVFNEETKLNENTLNENILKIILTYLEVNCKF